MAGVMYRSGLAELIAEKEDCTKAEADRMIGVVFDGVRDALGLSDRVTITRFGTFEIRDVAARRVKVIAGERAGEMVDVPRGKKVAFKQGAELKDLVGGRR